MRIDLQKLRDKGWQVTANKDEVIVYGETQMPFVADWMDKLSTLGISRREAEYLVDDLAMQVEQRLILRDGAG